MVLFPDYTNVAATMRAELREVGIQLNLKVLDIPAGSALMRTG